METIGKNEKFPFVHPSIAEFFSTPRAEDQQRGGITINPTTLMMELMDKSEEKSFDSTDSSQIQRLAYKCEESVFESSTGSSCFRPSLQGLVKLGETNVDAKITVAALLALNMLESAIRLYTKNDAGHAPLLKNMLDQVDNRPLADVLKLVLLPTPGLNLRNLLWHGFVSYIPRSYLALALVLIHNLEYDQPNRKEDQEPTILSLRGLPSFQNVLCRADTIIIRPELLLSSTTSIKAWLPVSHHSLFDVALGWIQERQYPACTCAVLSIILEHGLRLDWCNLNHRPDDRIARPGAFYVTLDGHGQRYKHDLLLHPYLSGGEENQLIHELGGSTIALLTDLFCSSCGGPNLRAALSHGLWDAIVLDECEALVDGKFSRTYPEKEVALWDLVGVVLVAMEAAAAPSMTVSYQPLFSYTAVTMQNIRVATQELERLEDDCQMADQFLYNSPAGPWKDLSSKLRVSMDTLRKRAKIISLSVHGDEHGRNAQGSWDVVDVFLEHRSNCKLSMCRASTVLLDDVAQALKKFRASLKASVCLLRDSADLRGGQHMRHSTVVSAGDLAFSVYGFAALVALISVEVNLGDSNCYPNDDLRSIQHAVERSRMVVSTFSTFITANAERATKAAANYAKAKCIRSIKTNYSL